MTYDDKLQKSFDEVFVKLERYYPERKVFALDSIDGTLRDKLSKLYKVAGFETVNEFLKAYGFEIISGDEVKKIRSFVLYTPGNEPDVIKSKVESMLKRLNEYYPNKIIPRGMQKDHKSLSQSVSGLYQWLGYDTSRDMLEAYGFDLQHGDSGRKENDYQGLINTLIEKYRDGDKPNALGVLIYENPEFKGQIKTLQNKSNELFGKSLADYFKEIGILGKNSVRKRPNSGLASYKAENITKPKKKTYNYFKLAVEGIEKPILCSIYTASIHEGAYVKVKDAFTDEEMIGCIVETCYNTAEEDMPKPFKEMAKYVRRVGVKERKEIEEAKIIYQLCTVEIKNSNSLQYYISTLQEIEVGDVVKVPLERNKVGFGIVIAVEYISGDKLPVPRKELKDIISIERNVNEKPIKTEVDFKTFVESYETEDVNERNKVNFFFNDDTAEYLKLIFKFKDGNEVLVYDDEINGSWIWAEGYGLRSVINIINSNEIEIDINLRYPNTNIKAPNKFNNLTDFLRYIEDEIEYPNWAEFRSNFVTEKDYTIADIAYIEAEHIVDCSGGNYWITGDKNQISRTYEKISFPYNQDCVPEIKAESSKCIKLNDLSVLADENACRIINDIWNCYSPYIRGKEDTINGFIEKEGIPKSLLKNYNSSNGYASFKLDGRVSDSSYVEADKILQIICRYPELQVACIMTGDMFDGELSVAIIYSESGAAYITHGEIVGRDAVEDDYIMCHFKDLFTPLNKELDWTEPCSGAYRKLWIKYEFPYIDMWRGSDNVNIAECNDNKACEGLTFVITGNVNNFKNRNELTEYIKNKGGKVTGTVSKNTNYLINNDFASNSTKNKKAKELGVVIITEEEFIKKFG